MDESTEQKVSPGREDTTGASLADMVEETEEVSLIGGVSPAGWAKVGVLSLLVVAFYREQLLTLYRQLLSNPNWSFGFIIPLFSLFLLYNWREELLRERRRVFLPGLALVLLAIVVRAYGIVILHNNWIPQLTIPLLIWGLVLYLGGPGVAKVTSVPIFFLAIAMPFPDRLYDLIALRLQNFAALMSAEILQACGVVINVSASSMEVTSVSGQVHPLTVAEACSGIRSLMAFVALGIMIAFIQYRPWWHRLTLVLAGVPIAIICNVLRVTTTATMFVIDKKELGEDFMHKVMGMALLIPALLLLFLLSRVLDSLFEDVDEDEENAEGENAPAELAGAEGDA